VDWMENKLLSSAELAHLRQVVRSLEGGAKVIRAGRDITQDELRSLRLEIAFLEKSVTLNTNDSLSQNPTPKRRGGTAWIF